MESRTVYGNTISENGWPMVDEASCQWIDVPGTDVSLQIQQGQPLQILQAFAADFNTEIEPLRDADSACWTPTNSVATSNHLSGTACDFNWNTHPFQVLNAGFNAAQIAKLRELLGWYENTVFWGNDWDSPKDAMHFQMGYNTYRNPATADFIRRKIRADGISTRRGGATPVTDAGNAIRTDDAATVLYDAVPIIDEDRAAELLGPISAGLAAAQCTNPKRIAEFLAQTGWESDGYEATEEYASGAAYEGRTDLGNTQPGDGVRFKGRGWIMLTGRGHYAAFGKWAAAQGLVTDPANFVNNPTALADLKWAGIVSAWYWTVARPQINSLCDAGDLVGVTKAINGGTNGLEDGNGVTNGRRTRYNQAIALGDRLLLLIEPPTDQGDDFMALTPAQQQELYDNVKWLREQLDATNFGPDSSMGQTDKGEELTVRDGLAESKRDVEAIKSLLTTPGVAVVTLQAAPAAKK